jgi:hypothetical protein
VALVLICLVNFYFNLNSSLYHTNTLLVHLFTTLTLVRVNFGKTFYVKSL